MARLGVVGFILVSMGSLGFVWVHSGAPGGRRVHSRSRDFSRVGLGVYGFTQFRVVSLGRA